MEKKVIVIGDRSGVFFGTLAERNGSEVKLTNCRRLWYWDGAASDFQLATDGVAAPQNCKFTVRVAEIEYPLDAKKAWMEWVEEQAPKRWKPAKGEKYWYLNEFMNVTSSFYDDEDFDAYTKVENTNNCFQSFKLAQQAADAVLTTLEQFHNDNQQ